MHKKSNSSHVYTLPKSINFEEEARICKKRGWTHLGSFDYSNLLSETVEVLIILVLAFIIYINIYPKIGAIKICFYNYCNCLL